VSSEAALHHSWRILRQNDDAPNTHGTVPAGLTIARRYSEGQPINIARLRNAGLEVIRA
jgi:hypothetical protein